MRLLIITDQFTRGGADRVTSVMCNELYHRGYDVHIVADTVNCPVSYPLDENIPIHQIIANPSRKLFLSTLRKWLSITRDIKNHINTTKPDIIIAIASRMYLCSLIAKIGQKHPLVVVDHTSFGRKQHPFIDFIRYHLYGFASGISILTKKDEKILGKKYPQKRVIYNPISFPILDEVTERRNNILCAGRMEVWKIKGFDIILDVWKQIEQKYPDWILEIAGDCDCNVKNEVETMVNERKLQGRVNLLGFVSDMKELFSHSSIFALSSRMEGFPMVLMEAMSQGCACVGFSVGGSTDEMMEDRSGFLVQDGDIESFKISIEKLIENAQLREEFSRNAIKAISKFSVKSFADSWETFISEMLRTEKRG